MDCSVPRSGIGLLGLLLYFMTHLAYTKDWLCHRPAPDMKLVSTSAPLTAEEPLGERRNKADLDEQADDGFGGS